MNIEEKAKAYDEALERAKDCLTDRKFSETDDTVRSFVEYIFPELAETNDERIRKALIDGVRQIRCKNGITQEQMLAYLEKQKDSKWSPSEDEMGVLYKLCYISNQVTDWDDTELTRLYQDLKREYFNGRSFENMFPSEKQKEQKPNRERNKPKESWFSKAKYEIEHADELLRQSQEELKEIRELKNQEQKPVEKQDYSGLNDLERTILRGFLAAGMENVPATIIKETAKECLAQMKPAEWSEKHIADIFEKVGLAKIVREQGNDVLTNALQAAMIELSKVGNTEWSEEDEGELQNAIDALEFLGKKGVYKSESGYDAALQAAFWLQSLPERFNLQPKKEWREVELEFRGEKVKVKRPFFRDDNGRGYSTTEQDEDVAWYALRAWCEKKDISLYDLYPREEWSEEDENMRDRLIARLQFITLNTRTNTTSPNITFFDEIAWLKSLRPSWKPSEEQMNALYDVIHPCDPVDKEQLESLYELLQKI